MACGDANGIHQVHRDLYRSEETQTAWFEWFMEVKDLNLPPVVDHMLMYSKNLPDPNSMFAFDCVCSPFIIEYPICKHLIDAHLYRFFTCLDINKNMLKPKISPSWQPMGPAKTAHLGRWSTYGSFN